MRIPSIAKLLGVSAALAAAIPLCAGSALAQPYFANRDMYVRFDPNAQSPKKLVIASGTPVRVIGGPSGDWEHVATFIGTGWTLSSNLTPAPGPALAYRLPRRHARAYTEGAGSSGPAAVHPYVFGGGRLIASQDMYVRFGPDAQSPKKLVIASGTPVRVIGGPSGDWDQIATPIGTGWALRGDLTRD